MLCKDINVYLDTCSYFKQSYAISTQIKKGHILSPGSTPCAIPQPLFPSMTFTLTSSTMDQFYLFCTIHKRGVLKSVYYFLSDSIQNYYESICILQNYSMHSHYTVNHCVVVPTVFTHPTLGSSSSSQMFFCFV